MRSFRPKSSAPGSGGKKPDIGFVTLLLVALTKNANVLVKKYSEHLRSPFYMGNAALIILPLYSS